MRFTKKNEPEIIDPKCDPDHPVCIDFEEITSAAYKIKSGVYYTSCTRSRLSDRFGIELYFKKDFLQYTGNFKERGARNALLMLGPEERKRGVAAASAGNHAQALSYHGLLLNIPVTVVMPVTAPLMKIAQCKKLKANVIVDGKDMADAKRIGLKTAKEQGLIYLNGFDHPDILAGAGTIGLEVVEQVPDAVAILCPTGGGGMLSGVSVAIKGVKPEMKVIGVESERCPGFNKSMKEGKPTLVQSGPTLADGLAVPLIGFNSFASGRPNIYKMILVREESIALAILRLIEEEKCICEGAGAVGLAAVMEGQLDEFKGKKIVLVLSGANIDTTLLGRCIDRGLASDGRLVKAAVTISDRPGSLQSLCQLVASTGASIKETTQDRAWITQDVFSVTIILACETRDSQHSSELRDLLKKNYSKLQYLDLTAGCHSPSDCQNS